MRTNKVVTIWHYGDLVIPVRRVFKNVYVDTTWKIDKNGIKQKGFFNSRSVVVRIPTTEEISVSPGDYIFIGESTASTPRGDEFIKILEVKDNRRGSQKHWRLACGG